MKIRYAAATGIYDQEDFKGPPPWPYYEVVDAKEVAELTEALREYLALASIDGKPERQALRQRLKRLMPNN